MMRIAPMAGLMLLGGCVSLGDGKIPDELIGLSATASAPAGSIGTGTLADALLVVDPETDQRLDVNRVPVRVDATTVVYLKDAQWIERPSRQFRRVLAETIRARGKRLVLEGSDELTGAKSVLSGRLLDMGYDAQESAVVVRFDALREDAEGKIEAKRFESVVPGVSPKAVAVAPALNQAANEVAGQVADWLE